jgi:hypothetical protein
MVGACSMYQRDERCIEFELKNMKRRDYLGDRGADINIILK